MYHALYILNGSGVSSIFGRQYLPVYVFVQRLDVAVHEDAVTYLLLEERFDEIKNRVDERTDVHHVDRLQLRWVCLLHADQELLHQSRCELGEVRGRRDGGVEDVDVTSHAAEFFVEAHIADHQHYLQQ